MKKFYSQLSLILALILVINLCNIGYVIEVKAEAEDTSNLSIDKVDLDTSNAANISKDCILTSKELTVSIQTISSSEDVQTFTLYKINGEEKELVNSVKVTPEYNESEYIAQQNIKLDAKEKTYSDYEYRVGVKSSSHPTEVYEDVKTSVDNADVKKIVIDTINPISENNKIKVKTWLEWSANGIESVEKVETEVKCTFRDDNSGIDKIEYQVDNGEKKDYKLDGNEIHNPGKNVNFAYKIEGKNHTIDLFITDNAGNEYHCSSNEFNEEKSDNVGPKIDSVSFEPYTTSTIDSTKETTTELKSFDEISAILYDRICVVSSAFTIKVKTTDIAQEGATVSGMSKDNDAVQLFDGNKFIGNMALENGYYIYTVNDSISADVLTIHAKDANGYKTIKKISEIDSSKKDSYYMEKETPTLKPDYKNAVNSNGQYWFNNNGGDFVIEVEDSGSGVKSVTITDEIKNDNKSVIKNYLNKIFDKQEKNYKQVIDTSLLDEGDHIFSVTVVDNCGNKQSEKYEIYVDHSEPEISYEVKAPNKKVIDNKDWYDINDELEIVATIKKSASDIKNVEFKVNNQNLEYAETIEEVNEKLIINLKVPVKNYIGNSENKISIVGYIESLSGNNNNSKSIYSCYIDKADPEINSITINKIDNALFQPTLNLISTGIYSNGSLKFKVEASDVQGDSGIDYVEFAYYKDGDRVVKKMTSVENRFEYILPFEINSEMFNSNFEIIAYDKYGKESKFIPSIKDEAGNSTDKYFVMQEDITPIAKINLPKSDGSERTDDQLWYNKNKNISIDLEDKQSGIRYVKIFVNGVEIVKDINGTKIVDTKYSKSSPKNITSLTYNFTTDYIIKEVGKAEDGKYKIKVEMSDNAGNIYVDNNKSFNIDETNPSVDKIEFSRKTSDGILTTNDFNTEFKYGYYFNNSFYLKIHTSDKKPSSGLSHIEYKLVVYNNGKKEDSINKTSPIVNGMAKIEIPKGFKGQIFVKAIDMVGNVSKQVTTLGYIEDESAPEIDIKPLKKTKYKDNLGNNLYSKNVSVDVSITDTKSGLKTIEYYVDAENNKIEKKMIQLSNEGYKEGDKLEDGWIVTKTDRNLVVKVSRKIVFSSDDNDIVAHFRASDMAGNKTKYTKTQKFSIDKTAPVIKIDFSSGVKSNSKYYNSKTRAIMNITVEERNFDKELLNIVISDSYHNNKINPKFVKEKGKYSYVATIDYPEGDYNVQVSANDIVGHKAKIHSNGGKKSTELYTAEFIVDTTNPSVSTNFSSFVNNSTQKEGNYFNKKKTATISVKEHNFDPELMNINVFEKEAGKDQSVKGAEKISYAAYSKKGWSDNGDTHSIELQFERDGIYKIEMKPSDISENKGETDSTVVFEIDTTAPEIFMINGESVDKKKTNTIDVYDEKRKDDASPTVEYYDANFDCIKYEIVKYIPEYQNGKEFSSILPETIKKTLNSKEFKLEDFKEDGIYAVQMTAYDKAGNASKVNKNTYVRMVKSDVLAYIEDSHPGVNGKIGKGWYSIEDEDGPLSKRPDNFENLNIAVITRKDSNISITLNSNDGDSIDTGIECSNKEEVYGAGVYRYVLSKDYFKDHYQEDTDATFYLTVNDSDKKIELGQIHIDNIAPECDLPPYFHNWGWMKGTGEKKIEITNISEKIDTSASTVYIDGEKVKYSYDSNKNKITFSIENGSHSVGISLVDYAGNKYNVPEISHLGVGNFRLYLGIGMSIVILAGVSMLIILKRKRKVENLE